MSDEFKCSKWESKYLGFLQEVFVRVKDKAVLHDCVRKRWLLSLALLIPMDLLVYNYSQWILFLSFPFIQFFLFSTLSTFLFNPAKIICIFLTFFLVHQKSHWNIKIIFLT